MEDEGMIMPLYWSCQELQNILKQENINRRNCIVSSIETNLAKFSSCSDRIRFQPDLTWFNVAEPLTRKSLDGLITVLDFFTYCCINCMHILPDLEKLEAEFPTGVAVIGVHSAKFENEKSETQLEHAIHRYNIEHPVCNDKSLHLWNGLGVTCWPTLLVLSPSGVPIQVLMGEGHSLFLMEYIHTAVDYFKGTGELVEGRIPRSLHSKAGGSNLKYPGKVTVFKQYLVVSDSGNNRVLVVEKDTGSVLHVVGSGDRGRRDGDFNTAAFNNPQGVCEVGTDLLMVADTDNHLLRLINLSILRVSTVGGTGVQGTDKEGGRLGPEQEISSPWDLTRVSEGAVAVAMAGIHQIWLYCLVDVCWWKGVQYPAGTLVRIAGSGAEENRNNSYPAKAGFAQPSGVSADLSSPAGALYIADSESSTVRRLDLKDGAVKNVCGGERDPSNLFAYGDQDEAGVAAKLQHPLAVAWNKTRSELYIADSYNHKIKKVTGPKNDTVSVVGGDTTLPADERLCEPGGLSVSETGDVLYIADTNNHAIKILNLDTLKLTKMEIKFPGSKDSFDSIVEHRIETGAFSGAISLTANLEHEEYKLNLEGSSSWTLSISPEGWIYPSSGDIKSNQILIPLEGGSSGEPSNLTLNLKLYLCHKTSGICVARRASHRIQVVPCDGARPVDTLELHSLVSI